MRINAVNVSNQQKVNTSKKSNPNFGIKLCVDLNMRNFVQKEALNLASSEGKFAHYYVKSFLGMFIKGMNGFANFINDLEPKDLTLFMGLTNKGMEYLERPGLDGKLYLQQTKEKPVYIGFMNPMNTQSNLIAKPVDFPYTEAKAMENLEDVVILADTYKEIVQYKNGSKNN